MPANNRVIRSMYSDVADKSSATALPANNPTMKAMERERIGEMSKV